MLGATVAASDKTPALITELRVGLADIEHNAASLTRRLRVYFEEWNDPPHQQHPWVSELIGIAGGEDCFAERASSGGARGRIIADPAEVIEYALDIIIGSWCGKHFGPNRSARARAGPRSLLCAWRTSTKSNH